MNGDAYRNLSRKHHTYVWVPLENLLCRRAQMLFFWSWRRDSNPRPSDYKSDALPAELRQQSWTAPLTEHLHCPLGSSAYVQDNSRRYHNGLSRANDQALGIVRITFSADPETSNLVTTAA